MSESSPPYVPTTIAKVFELLDNKLVSLGIPGALALVGITKARESQWSGAVGCLAGAAGVWLVIKIGSRLAPKLDQGLDWLITTGERSLLEGLSALRSDFEGQYLKRQAGLCDEFEVEGFTPDRTAILLLEEVFVPLDLSGAFVDEQRHRELARLQHDDPMLTSENLSIWELLARSRRDRKFRQMSILAKGGMGKTTLLRHIALLYGQRKQRRGVPKLVPVLLRLRDWSDALTGKKPPSLPHFRYAAAHISNVIPSAKNAGCHCVNPSCVNRS